MTERKETNTNPFQFIIGLILLIILLIGLWYLARFLFTIFLYLTPIMIVAAFILDRKVVINFFKSLWNLTKRNTALGLGAILLSLLGIPFVSLYLLGRALLGRQINKAQKEYEKQQQGEFIDYEEVDESTLELPPLDQQQEEPPVIKEEKKEKDKDSDYEQLFD